MNTNALLNATKDRLKEEMLHQDKIRCGQIYKCIVTDATPDETIRRITQEELGKAREQK